MFGQVLDSHVGRESDDCGANPFWNQLIVIEWVTLWFEMTFNWWSVQLHQIFSTE